MASSNQDEKILRIGVIQGGKVIEERLIRKRSAVTFGSDNKNTFVFSGPDVPKSWSLFEVKGAQYQLVFSDSMDGRVSVEDNNVDFASLKAQNLAQKQGDRFRMVLNDASRGRVQFGSDLTILFHFVAAPPVAAKPTLPVSAQGGWVKSIEPVFTTTLTLSFLLHAAFTIVVHNVEPPPPPSREEVLRAIARVQPPKIETPPEVPTEAPPDSNKKGDKPKVKADPKPEGDGEKAKQVSKGKPNTPSGAKAASERRAAVRDAIQGKGLLAMIGASGGGDADSAVGNVFSSGSAIGGDLQSAIEGTQGVGVAGGGGEVTRRGAGGGGGGGGAADIGGLEAGGSGPVGTGTKKVAKVTGRVQAADISDVDGTIDKKGVAQTIRRRQKAFQQCYESALKSNSKLAGKLSVEFVIDDNGRVREARVVRDGLNSAEVSKCVVGTLKRLRFPKPDDGEVTITNVFVFQPGG